MLRSLAQFVTTRPRTILALWAGLLAVCIAAAPAWEDVAEHGEFTFLPDDVASRQAEDLYRAAFPVPDPDAVDPTQDYAPDTVQQDPLGSNVVILVRRADPLAERDFQFVEQVLVPELRDLPEALSDTFDVSPVRAIFTHQDAKIGQLLVSDDQQAMLVVVELETGFLDRRNQDIVDAVEQLFSAARPDIRSKVPVGLEVAISGSATVGRDMLEAEARSAWRTRRFAMLVAVLLVAAVVRAPLLVAVPLLTILIAFEVTTALLAVMAQLGWVNVFAGLEIYLRVIVYATGISYCLVLFARYREGLDLGQNARDALAAAFLRTSTPLAAAAGTSILGTSMLAFSQFGKFRQAGIGVALGLLVVSLAMATFVPALLCLFRHHAFWPFIRTEKLAARSSRVTVPSLGQFLHRRRLIPRMLDWMTQRLASAPLPILCGALILMAPLAVVGLLRSDDLSYGLLSDLPQHQTSVQSAKAIQQHFPAGVAGPVTILIHNPKFNFDPPRTAESLSQELTEALRSRKEELNLADIRSQSEPLGLSKQTDEMMQALNIVQRNSIRVRAARYFVSSRGPYAGKAIRFDLLFHSDPFSRTSIDELDAAEEALRAALPMELRASTRIAAIGATAKIRDLKLVTDADRFVTGPLVVLAVSLVLFGLLRPPRGHVMLIASVVLTYFVTLGATSLVFEFFSPDAFQGLDWKVPIVLFTLLIAVGEDYNILLVARLKEEREQVEPVHATQNAVRTTGGLISRYAIVTAGIFATLMTAELRGLVQQGFALAFGILLNGFVIRPFVLPAWLILLQRRRAAADAPHHAPDRASSDEPSHTPI